MPDQMDLFGDAPLSLLTVEEIYLRADAELLRRLSEDRRIERKPAGFSPREVGDYASMWANTPGGGLIVLGMDDDGTFTGCADLATEHLNELEKAPHTFCPQATFVSRRVPVETSKGPSFVLLFRVYYNDRRVVRTSSHRAWTRRGDSKNALSEDEIRELQNLKQEVLYEQEPCALRFPADFDTGAIADFARQVRARNGISDDITDVAIMLQRRLGKTGDDGAFQPNVACALLFALDPRDVAPGCRVRFMRFEGIAEGTGTGYTLVKNEVVEGTVPQIIVGASKVVAAQVRDFSRLGPDGKFVTAAEYPRDAWYEAVVNACAHRSYSLNTMDVFVRMYDDRLEITSPGGLPPMVTPENIYDMQSPVNPALMEALRYLEYVKAANEGTKRMRNLMERSSLPAPEFISTVMGYAQVKVILRNDREHRRVYLDADAIRVIGERAFSRMTSDERRVVNCVVERGSINVSDAMRLLDRGWESTKALLMRLADQGHLRHVSTKHKDPRAHFVLADAPPGGRKS